MSIGVGSGTLSVEHMRLARDIHAKLGGSKFSMMTGARDWVAIEGGLRFRLPLIASKRGINCVTITANSKGLFDIRYLKATNVNVKQLRESLDVSIDKLRETFEAATGLYTAIR